MTEYLTRAEVADLLRVHPLTVRNWIAHEGLPVIYLSKQTSRISRAALEEWLSQRTERSVAN